MRIAGKLAGACASQALVSLTSGRKPHNVLRMRSVAGDDRFVPIDLAATLKLLCEPGGLEIFQNTALSG